MEYDTGIESVLLTKNMNLSIITTVLISSFVTVLSGVITNWIYDVLKRKGYLPDQLNNKSIIILVACIITLTAMYLYINTSVY